jgi:hypothetical protein
MDQEQVTDTKQIQDILEKGICPICNKPGGIENYGQGEIGIGTSNGKQIPTEQWIDFLCKKCNNSFRIPKSLYDKYK